MTPAVRSVLARAAVAVGVACAATAVAAVGLLAQASRPAAQVAAARFVRYALPLRLARAPLQETVVFSPAVRRQLAREWTTGARQDERAYCLLVSRAPNAQGDTTATVVMAVRAVASVATPYSIMFSCGPRMPVLHVHTPTTCLPPAPKPPGVPYDVADYATCVAGGADAFSCFPSAPDLFSLLMSETAWAAIQCDAGAFVVYYREQAADLVYRTPTSPTRPTP